MTSRRLPAYREPVTGHLHCGFELPEPRDDTADGEVRIAHRPGGADTRGAEKGNDGLTDVGQIPDNAVTRLDADTAQVAAIAAVS